MKGVKMGDYKYGDPIPEQFRNRLFEWEGGGYNGCIWEMNQGMVDNNGHWCPIYSTGCGGIDVDGWYRNKIDCIKREYGFEIGRPAKMQLAELQQKAIREVFGKEWYKDPECLNKAENNKKFLGIVSNARERYEKFEKERQAYLEEKTHRLDSLFMQAKEDKSRHMKEIGLLDDEHIKETCRLFCERYSGNVGMSVNCLNGLMKLGYEPWLTCTDCGEQFRCDTDTFDYYIDNDAYTGDGGIGIIYKRVLCDDCRSACECENCHGMSLPNRNKDGDDTLEHYDFLACVFYSWLNVCDDCAYSLRHDAMMRYDDKLCRWVNIELGDKYDMLVKEIVEFAGIEEEKGHELYEKLASTPEGRGMINKVRDLLADAAKENFHEIYEYDWYARRLNEKEEGNV